MKKTKLFKLLGMSTLTIGFVTPISVTISTSCSCSKKIEKKLTLDVDRKLVRNNVFYLSSINDKASQFIFRPSINFKTKDKLTFSYTLLQLDNDATVVEADDAEYGKFDKRRLKKVFDSNTNQLIFNVVASENIDYQTSFRVQVKCNQDENLVCTIVVKVILSSSGGDIGTLVPKEEVENLHTDGIWRADYVKEEIEKAMASKSELKEVFWDNFVYDVTPTSISYFSLASEIYIGEVSIYDLNCFRAILTTDNAEKLYVFDINDSKGLCSTGTTFKVGNTEYFKNKIKQINPQIKEVSTLNDHFLDGFTNLTSVETASYESKGKYSFFSNNLISIGNWCFNNLKLFNSPLDFSTAKNLESIGDNFLAESFEFNQPLDFSQSALRSIGSIFLGGLINTDPGKFNSTIEFSNSLKHIGYGFLREQSNFNQPLTIPKSVDEIYAGFMYDCRSYTNTITILTKAKSGQVVPFVEDSNAYENFSTNNYTAEMYTQGIKIKCKDTEVANNLSKLMPNFNGAETSEHPGIYRNINWQNL